jgi:hypothetical protein
MQQENIFDFNEILEQYKQGKKLIDGLPTPLIKQLTKTALELESHIADDVHALIKLQYYEGVSLNHTSQMMY